MTLVAGAPITWGVSELPTWGWRMPPERVLAEMREAGLAATELGPPGYLPDDPERLRALLERHGVQLVAGFLAAVLHDAGRDPGAEIEHQAKTLAAGGASVLVLAAALPGETYDPGASLSAAEWVRLNQRVDEAAGIARRHRLELAFHPHAGTAVAMAEDVDRLLTASDVGLCLDTGHLHIGGADPVRIAEEAGGRVTHVHLKDVDTEVAERYRAGRIGYADAVREGLYTPLGDGDLDIPALWRHLKAAGYRGWFVLEQDTALTGEPEPGEGPLAAARRSLEYFSHVTSAVQTTRASKEE